MHCFNLLTIVRMTERARRQQRHSNAGIAPSPPIETINENGRSTRVTHALGCFVGRPHRSVPSCTLGSVQALVGTLDESCGRFVVQDFRNTE